MAARKQLLPVSAPGLRILRAKQLLTAGVKPSEVAPRVGLYDQSQLNRRFRRLVGTTPGAYARQQAR